VARGLKDMTKLIIIDDSGPVTKEMWETVSKKLDPRDPDYSREGVFQDHNCYVCDSGKKPCVKDNPRDCDTLHARND
jgi:hypothetical protein